MRRTSPRIGSLIAVAAVLLWAGSAAAIPPSLTHQGRLLKKNGDPMTGTATLKFTLYDSKTGGAIVWQSASKQVNLGSNGFYSVSLGGSSNPIDASALSGDKVWVSLTVNGSNKLSPRIRLRSVPYAVRSGTADEVDWGDVSSKPSDISNGDDDTLASLNCGSNEVAQWDGSSWTCTASGSPLTGQSCNMGEVATGIDQNNQLTCQADRNTTYSKSCGSGQVVGGLSSNGSVTCVADQDTNTTYSKNCGAGQVVGALSSNGSVTCVNDTDTNTTYSAGGGLDLSATNSFSLSDQQCSSGNFVEGIQGGTLQCASPGTGDITAVNAGTGLNGGGNSGSVTLSVDESRYVEVAGDTMTGKLTVDNGNDIDVSDEVDVGHDAGNCSSSSPCINGVNYNQGVFGGSLDHWYPGSSSDDEYQTQADGMTVEGDFNVTGSKNFITPHPNDPSKEIVYVCQEGGEAGIYWRGSARLSGGRAVVELPDHFSAVAADQNLTATVTPRGGWAPLYVEEVTPERLVVGAREGFSRSVDFDYRVEGIREMKEGHEPVQENTHFSLRYEGGEEEFERQYREMPEVQQVLIENGILNPDGSLNRQTARELGWELEEE